LWKQRKLRGDVNASCLSAVQLPDSVGGNWLPRKMLQLSGLGRRGGKCKSFHSYPRSAGKQKEGVTEAVCG
jgi:hypothetical protein